MIVLYVVRFASGHKHPETGEKDPPKIMLISEREHDRWCEAEPPEGYDVFETLHSFECEHITVQAMEEMQRLYEEVHG